MKAIKSSRFTFVALTIVIFSVLECSFVTLNIVDVLEKLYPMIDFSTISRKAFKKLTRIGRLNPHCNEFTQIGMVIEGKKPVALLPEDVANYASRYRTNENYLTYELIPQLSHCGREFATCGLYRKGDRTSFVALCDAYDLYPYDLSLRRGIKLDKNTVKFDIALGRALGYADTDIAHFLGRNYGYKKMKEGLQ
jgi:hypothetical protein